MAAAHQQYATLETDGLQLTDHFDGIGMPKRQIDDRQVWSIGLDRRQKYKRVGELARLKTARDQHVAHEGADWCFVVKHVRDAAARRGITEIGRRNHPKSANQVA